MTRRIPRVALMATGLLVAGVCTVSAQTRRAPRAPRFEISAGAMFVGGFSGNEKSADITANQTGGTPYTLFKSRARIDSAPSFEARLGFRLSPRFVVEGGVFTGRPELSTRLTGDIESAPDTTASETLSVYIIDAAILANFATNPTQGVVPFVRAGFGYVRELHEDNALVQTGTAFHAGGGVTFWLNGRHTVGARADARVYVIKGGIDLDGGTRTQGAGGGAIVFAF